MVGVNVKEADGLIILNLSGEFYNDSIENVEKLYKDLAAKKPGAIAFNCNRVTNIDSSALGLMVKLFKNSVKIGTEMIIYDINDNIMNVFKVTKLDTFFKVLTKAEFDKKYPQ